MRVRAAWEVVGVVGISKGTSIKGVLKIHALSQAEGTAMPAPEFPAFVAEATLARQRLQASGSPE